MKKTFLLILLLTVAAVPISAAGVVGAQTNTTETNSTTDQLNNDAAAVEEVSELTGETQQVERIRVDDSVSVVGWGYDAEAEVFQIVFESDRPRRVTLTESIQRAEGSGTFSVTTQRLNADQRTLVELPVPANGGEAAVGITTTASLREGGGTYLSTGISKDRPPITWESAQLLIILSATGSAAGAIRYVAKKRDDETKTSERVL